MNVFTYGSLTFTEVLGALTEQEFLFEDIILSGFDRRKLVGKKYPGLFKSAGSQVEGRLYYDLDDLSMKVLDRFEDPIYERRKLMLSSPTKGSVEALAYVVPTELEKIMSSEPWDREEFRTIYLHDYLDMCRKFRADVLKHMESE